MDELRNYMEASVDEMLEPVIKSLNGCMCDKCKIDTKAIALNSLPPKYIATRKGEFYTRLNLFQQQFEVDIISAITRAVVIVKKNPRHDEDEDSILGSGVTHEKV